VTTSSTAGPVITVAGLHKSYGRHEAVKGIDFEVAAGEIFGLLGTNGAGKTTTIEILEGYRRRSAGDVQVLGLDPSRPTRAWRERIGLVLQESEVDPVYTVREIVGMFARYYTKPRNVDDTITLVGLHEQRDTRVGQLSGGQKRRVDVALGIVGDPDLVFLDEPTTGFDPQARRDAWNMIQGLRDLGKTILLTTHYMDEAQHLADRLTICATVSSSRRGRRRSSRNGRVAAPSSGSCCRPGSTARSCARSPAVSRPRSPATR
jgi:ABC-2 type transport system ATP-binding protein